MSAHHEQRKKEREVRQATELRANLLKRKAQARAQAAEHASPDQAAHPGAPDESPEPDSTAAPRGSPEGQD